MTGIMIDATLINTDEIGSICFLDAFRQEFGISDINSDWSKYPASCLQDPLKKSKLSQRFRYFGR